LCALNDNLAPRTRTLAAIILSLVVALSHNLNALLTALLIAIKVSVWGSTGAWLVAARGG